MDVTCNGSKVRCSKEQYCIGTWNVRSMNQGKLEVVKQEMARVNIDILEFSKLKWIGMGEFNSDDHYIYYCGQESLTRNGVALIVNKRVLNAVLGRNLKSDRMMISVHFQGKPFNITVIQAYSLTNNAEEAEVECFYEDLQDLLELTPKKDALSIIGDWHSKIGSQEIPGITDKFGLGVQNEAGQRLTEFAKRTHWSWQTPSSNNTREDSTHGHHQMVNTKIRLILFFAAKDGEALYSQQKQDQELTVAQVMNSLLPNSDLN